MDVRRITAAMTRVVRHPVLRAGLPPESAILPHDDDVETRHFGAFDGDRLIGVATFFPEAYPGRPDDPAWRLRGMATLENRQRGGVGRALIEEGVRAAKEDGAPLIWCNARVTAQVLPKNGLFVAVGPSSTSRPQGSTT
jgi:GNAT superfamily N-acetyltransferase